MTFVLDNRNDEMSSAAYRRLEYVQTNIEENVERMLYYARIKMYVQTMYLNKYLFLIYAGKCFADMKIC